MFISYTTSESRKIILLIPLKTQKTKNKITPPQKKAFKVKRTLTIFVERGKICHVPSWVSQ